jgi:hypothetical protein
MGLCLSLPDDLLTPASRGRHRRSGKVRFPTLACGIKARAGRTRLFLSCGDTALIFPWLLMAAYPTRPFRVSSRVKTTNGRLSTLLASLAHLHRAGRRVGGSGQSSFSPFSSFIRRRPDLNMFR